MRFSITFAATLVLRGKLPLYHAFLNRGLVQFYTVVKYHCGSYLDFCGKIICVICGLLLLIILLNLKFGGVL